MKEIYRKCLKRGIDFSISLMCLLILSSVLIIVAILIKIFQGGRIFYVQKRPGYLGEIFKVIKFKTMTEKKDENGMLLPDKDRISKIGYFLRNTSLDELPQLFNILKGDMSFVGPRPLLVQYLDLYSEFQKKRHDVRPGLTGWAQVNGRNNIPWSKKFELDVWYVENMTFIIDLKIIYLTIKKAITKQDISKDGYVTTEAFNGYN